MKLEFNNTNLAYSKSMHNVLSNINLHVDSEKIAIVGSNGSGKTTIIKGIMGLAETTKGEIRLFGTELKNMRKMTGISCNLDTIYRLLDLTVKKKVELYCLIDGIDPDRVFKHIESYELTEILAKKTRELSTGQNKAFCNIMALELGYKLALLDEPFESLDVRRRLMMVSDLKNFQGSLMINTHDFGTLKSLPNWGRYLIIEGNLYGKFSSSDINRLYLTKGVVPSALTTIRTSYGTFCVTLDSGDAPLSSSTDLVNSIQDVVQ